MVLLEREQLLRSVSEYLAEAAAGRGRLVFVAGEAGAGKTSFVSAATAAAGSSVIVAAGGCDGSLTPAPLAPLVDMLPDLPPEIWPPGAERHEVFTRLTSMLRQATTAHIVVIEDVHWADEATLDLLRHLARRVHTLRALILVTYRKEDTAEDHPLRVLLGDVATAAGTRRLDLPALSVDAIRTLSAELAEPSQTVIDPVSLHQMTGGNPFFVTEVLAAGGTEIPATVRDAVLARAARLGPDARHVLDVVALAGPRAELDLIESIVPGSGAALDEAIGRGVLQLTDQVLMFRHELARIAIAEQVLGLRQIGLHRRILDGLERRTSAEPSPRRAVEHARMAHHAEAARDHDAVLRHAPLAAAQAAALGSHFEAVLQYRRTLRHAGSLDATQQAEFLGLLAYECYLTDRIDDAIDAQREALAIWEVTGNQIHIGDTHRSLSRLHWLTTHNSLAEDHAAQAVEALTGTDGVQLAMAYSNQAQLRMLAGDLAGTRHWGTLALDLLDRIPATTEAVEARVHVLNNLGTAESDGGDNHAGKAMLMQSLDLARARDFHEHAARAYTNLASADVVAHRHEEAGHHIADGLDYCAERDLDLWSAYIDGWEALRLLNLGNHNAALARATAILRKPHLPAISRILPLTVLASATARLGHDDWATPLDSATALANRAGAAERIVPIAAARYEIAWLTGDLASASAHAAEIWPLVAHDSNPWLRGTIATWLTSKPDGDLPSPFAAETSGQWENAAADWERLGSRFAQALALARSGTRDGLARAAGIFDETGATAFASRARALSRAHGWAPPRGAREPTRAHPAGLTQREAEVLSLVEAALTDAQIAERLVLSRRTVEHHVSSILAKVGVTSRRQLIDLSNIGSRDRRDR